jgi:hypothetical protein
VVSNHLIALPPILFQELQTAVAAIEQIANQLFVGFGRPSGSLQVSEGKTREKRENYLGKIVFGCALVLYDLTGLVAP